jgi:hypothetical protein
LFLIIVETCQNWDHVHTVIEHLNRLPSKQPRTDVMRIRPWYILFCLFCIEAGFSCVSYSFLDLYMYTWFLLLLSSFNLAYGEMNVTH